MADLDNILSADLIAFIERIESVTEEKQGLIEDIKDIYLELKSQGYDPKTTKKIVRLRKMEKDKRDEEAALLEVYSNAVGL